MTRTLRGAGGTAAATLAVILAGASPVHADRLDRVLDRIAATPGAPPGLTLVIHRGERRDVRTRGLARLAPRQAPTARDHVRIASISKAYSSAVALALVADGRLALDDTIGEHLPELLPKGEQVTVAQMLRHTSGLPDYIRDPAFVRRLQRAPGKAMAPRRLVGYVRADPLEFPPGSRYHYSDTDNIVVALMAEKVAGMPYERLLDRLVLRPLGLGATTLPRTLRMPRPTMHGYELGDGAPEDVTRFINPALAWASGGIVSTPLEVGAFVRGFLGGATSPLGGTAVRPGQASFVAGSSSPPGPGRNASGLGVFRYRTGCGTVYGHTGSFPGYRLFAAASADGRRSVSFAANAQVVPGQGSARASRLMRKAQALAVCQALR